MNDIETVRYALNAADDEVAWDAFNRIITEVEQLREDKEFQYEQRKIMFAQLQKNHSEIERLREELVAAQQMLNRLRQDALDRMANNARELGLGYD